MTASATPSTIPGTALVTGASAGIGATYARRLAERGHDLILVARDQQRLEHLAADLRTTTGVKVEVLKADLSARSDLALVERRLRDDAAITTLINNAGIAVSGPLLGADPDRLEAMIQLNTVAVTRLAVAAADAFVAQGRGLIVNIASVLALAPELFNGSYSGTKAYVLNLTQALNHEVKDRGVRVQAVLPGATRTEIWERAGVDIADLPKEMLMGVDEMVDAALAGLDQGELITIPSLPDAGDWEAFTAARFKLGPNLSRDRAADRYRNGHAGAN
jgi:short-subunit dehydrogenase